MMKFKLIIVVCVIFTVTSCKKKNTDEQICANVNPTAPAIPNVLLEDIKANGFFVFQKYFSIIGNVTQYDSSFNYAGVTLPSVTFGYNYQTPFTMGFFLYDYDHLKVNGIPYKMGYLGYYDSTNANIIPPRNIDFMGDNIHFNFDTLNYIDNTLMPNYTGVSSLPDSVQFNKTTTLNFGTRSNTLESSLFFGINYVPYRDCYISNSTSSITIPYYDIPDIGIGYNGTYRLTLRNWTVKTINTRKYYVICEHIYLKKIKFYN